MLFRSSIRASSLLSVAVAIAACSETDAPPGPTSLEILRGPPAAGSPGAVLIDTLRIRLVDDKGAPQANVPMIWTVVQGGGTIIPLSPTTDASGVVEAQWRLGQNSGINQAKVVSPEDSTVTFQTVGEAFRVDRLDSNYSFACGLTSGDLWCWGTSAPGAEGSPVSLPEPPFSFPFDAPGLVAEGQGYTGLAVGWLAVCAIDPAGTVDCFTTTGPIAPSLPSMRQITGSDNDAYCGIATADSTAWCWNIIGGFAGGQVAPAPKFRSIEMNSDLGGPHTACGLGIDSTAYCWGAGPLGDGTFNSSATPVPVSGGRKYIELAVGDDFGCGLEADGDVWCWGRNDDGQLGNSGPDAAAPILSTSGVTRIAAALRTVLAIRLGTVVRWGYFGLNGGGNPITPLASVSHLPVADLAANDISCLRLSDGQVYCFDEIWVNSTTVDIDRYTPVQPVVTP